MRSYNRYPETIKAMVLSKLLSQEGKGVVELSKEFNIPTSTIRTWEKEMYKTEENKSPQNKKEAEKFEAVIETMGKTEEEKSIYCRSKGIYISHLEQWKAKMLEGLKDTTVPKAEIKEANNVIKKLKADLNRKDKALSEVTALLILKKKADLIFGVSEED